MPSTAAVLVRLCGVDEWSLARDRGGIDPELPGRFVHLSTLEQVHPPANRLYRGRADLVLLHIRPAALGPEVRREPGVATDPESVRFPPLYGPLAVPAATSVA